MVVDIQVVAQGIFAFFVVAHSKLARASILRDYAYLFASADAAYESACLGALDSVPPGGTRL